MHADCETANCCLVLTCMLIAHAQDLTHCTYHNAQTFFFNMTQIFMIHWFQPDDGTIKNYEQFIFKNKINQKKNKNYFFFVGQKSRFY